LPELLFLNDNYLCSLYINLVLKTLESMSICKDVHYYFWFPHVGTWLSEHMHNYYPNFREQYRHPHQKRLFKEELPMMKTLEEEERPTYFQRMSRDSGLLGLSVLHRLYPLYAFHVL